MAYKSTTDIDTMYLHYAMKHTNSKDSNKAMQK